MTQNEVRKAAMNRTLKKMRDEVEKLPDNDRQSFDNILADLRVMMKSPIHSAAIKIAVIEQQLAELR